MTAPRILIPVVVLVALLCGCGDDDSASDGSTSSTTTHVTEPSSTTTTSAPVGLEQLAIWPSADVVFDTPEEAAEDFVTNALGVPPTLGEFRQGDSRSGEIDVLSPGEGDGTSVVRGLLLLRQLGPDNGWFILAAPDDNASITSPASADEVAAGPLAVEGRARGFEANVVVTAFGAGDADAQFDQKITQGGALESPEPFTVTLDLSDARSGDTAVLLVQGGTGLETDPGDFGAIPVMIKA